MSDANRQVAIADCIKRNPEWKFKSALVLSQTGKSKEIMQLSFEKEEGGKKILYCEWAVFDK